MKSDYKYPLVKDTIGKDDLSALSKWLTGNPRLTKSNLTTSFEKEWSKWNGNKYSVFVNSGSSANLLMAYALVLSGRLKNDLIVVPAVSWVTTVSPFIQSRMEPILCDCDPNNLGLDVDHFEKLCKEYRPSAVIIVHVLGHPNHMAKILEICKKYDVVLLEDCCEAHGSKFDKKKVGTFGLASSFSFYYGHHMSTIEGGMVVTDDEELYNLMLSIRSHGWARDLQPKFAQQLKDKYEIDEFRNKYTFYYPGFNFRSTDLNAFLGLRQLKKLNSTVNNRYRNYKKFRRNLSDYFWTQTSDGQPISSFAIGLISEDLPKITSALNKNSIETRPLICGSIGEQPFWIDLYGKTVLPNATKIHHHGFYIPGNQDLTDREINDISAVLVSTQKRLLLNNLSNLTIAVCTRNSETEIKSCLENIRLVAPESELIVVDADSTDNTKLIARKYTKKIFSDRKKGLSFARQIGIDRAKHDLVAFVGSDDLITRESLLKMVSELKMDPKLAGVQVHTLIDNPTSYWEKATNVIFELLLNVKGDVDVIGTPCVFRKQILKVIRYDSNIRGGTDDTDICWRLKKAGYTLKKIESVSYENRRLDLNDYIARWIFYGKGDAQFFNKYKYEWSFSRKIRSITHPLMKYSINGSAVFIGAHQYQYLPALIVASFARYFGWIKEASRL